ncbi:hypothetical protein QUF51_08160 [Bacillus pumilus]|nr:hypothetical protein [Bacillus pumilus]
MDAFDYYVELHYGDDDGARKIELSREVYEIFTKINGFNDLYNAVQILNNEKFDINVRHISSISVRTTLNIDANKKRNIEVLKFLEKAADAYRYTSEDDYTFKVVRDIEDIIHLIQDEEGVSN